MSSSTANIGLDAQPLNAAEIDWANPITRDLRIATYIDAGSLVNAVTGSAATRVVVNSPNAIPQSVGSQGRALTYDGDYHRFVDQKFDPAKDFTLVCLIDHAAVRDYASVFNVGSVNDYLLFQIQPDNTGLLYALGATNLSDTADWTGLHIGVLTHRGATNYLTLYRDNVSTAGGQSNFTKESTNSDFTIGDDIYSGNDGFDGKYYTTLVFNRELTLAEIASISSNPYQVFQAQSSAKVIDYVVPAVGGAVTHATSGVLANAGATVAGTAAHIAIHTTTGVLANAGAAVAGTSARFRAFDTSGVLANAGATVAGTSARFRAFTTSGALANSGAAVAGEALNFTPHDTTGVLANAGAAVAGDADHIVAGGTHETTGALANAGATVAGTAAHIAVHTTTGALANAGAAIAGSALNYTLHATTGDLASTGATLAGEALHTFAITHETSGVLAGWGAELTGAAVNGTVTVAEHFSGNYGGTKKKKKKAQSGVVEAPSETPELFIADAIMASRDATDSGIQLIDGIDQVSDAERKRRYRILAAAALLTAH